MTASERRIWYLDTSVALRIALGHSHTAAEWFKTCLGAGDAFLTSRLTILEASRTLRREGLNPGLTDDFFAALTLVSVDDALLTEAGALRPHVKSLDALHLASALRVGLGAVTIATHDTTMLRAADALGLDAHDPVTE